MGYFRSALEALISDGLLQRAHPINGVLGDNLSNHGVAIPWNIGCGLAGGDWSRYKGLLEWFETRIVNEIVLYKLD